MLAIRLTRFHFPYSIEARKLGYEKILDKSTLQNYLSNESYFVEINDNSGKPKQIRFNGSSATTAIFFKYSELGIDLKNNFTPNPTADESDAEILGTDTPEIPDSELSKDEQQTIGF